MSTQIPPGGPPVPNAAAATAPEDEETVIDDVPATVRDAAKRAFTLRDRTAAVLDLVSDSLLDDTSPEGPRELRFGGPEQPAAVTVRVQEHRDGLLLHLESGQARVLEIQFREDVLAAEELAAGRWSTSVIGHGLLSVMVEAGQQRACTAWLRI